MRSRTFRFGCKLLAMLLTTVAVVACGSEISGSPVRVRPNVPALDVGNYQAQPRKIGNARSEKQARAREAQRLADYVALPYEADPSYVEDTWLLRTHIVLNRKTLGNLVINDTFDDVATDLVAGWVNAWSTGGPPDAPRRTLNIAVLMFPDAETAKSVGPTLEHDDFTYNPDNQAVSLTRYPDTYAHWRPGIGSIGSWTVHDRYVIFIKVVDDIAGPDLPVLTDQVERMLAVQVPLLDTFQPTPAADLSRIPLDPQGLLGRTVPSDPDAPFRPEPDGLYTGRGAVSLFFSGSPDILPLLAKHQVDLVSFGDTVVFRSGSAAGAESLWQEWRLSKDLDPDQKIVSAPTGLAESTECLAEYVGPDDNRTLVGHLCMMRVDRYVVQARSKQLPDLHQKISAQFSLLTSE